MAKIAYKSDEVRVPILLYIISQLSPRHPFRDKLKGIERDTPERHNIRVIQASPHHSLFVEQLQNCQGMVKQEVARMNTSLTFSRSVVDTLSRLMQTFTLRVPS